MSKDDYAHAVLQAGRDTGVTPRGIVIGFATVSVESDWLMYANSKVPESLTLPHDAVGSDGFSVGLFQQQIVKSANGYWWADCATCMDPYKSAALFFGRLKKLDYNGPNSPGSYAQAVQGSAFPDRYDQRMADAQAIYDRLKGGAPLTDPNRPDFNEYPVWSPNSQSRNGTKIDLLCIHTQEGDGNADSLAHYLGGNVSASYHYTVSQAPDGGVTVCDVVDTDRASWSVLSANNRSINLCFAGSKVAWTPAQWMQQSKAIDVAAYILVQDAKKYGVPINVQPPPYSHNPPTISDHAYVTQWLKDGTHTDVGPNFPWPFFAAAVTKYATGGPVTPPPGGPVPTPNVPDYNKETWDQIRGRWAMLGDHTMVEAIAQIRDKVCGTSDAGKPGVSFD